MTISTVLIGDRKMFTVTAHDISERQKLDHMKDEFISTVSHELRTPLTSIKGALGLIAGGALDNDPEKIKSVLQIAYENSNRMNMLVDDLLTFQKARLSEISLALETISANALIDRAIAANLGYASKYEVDITWTPNPKDVYIKVDEDRLIQVLSNVLSNAIKYSPKQGRVSVSTSHSETEVRISVADAGPGIPVEFQDKVFEKFSQADSSDTRQRGGTGLGMAISKSLLEQHGGRISFLSQPGLGTTFHIDLPIADPDV